MKKIIFRISRFKPGVIDPPEFKDFQLSVNEHMTVLDCLEIIRLELDQTLMYRHSCHHSSCGTCAVLVNGSEKLACTTKVWSLGTTTVRLEPLKGFERMGDLVVNLSTLYSDIDEDWTYLQTASSLGSDPLKVLGYSFTRFENCIECGCCISACPVSRKASHFIGPAGLSAMNREKAKSPRKKPDILRQSAGKRGVRMCIRALACSRVCPTAVYPAKHIAELKSDISNNEDR